MTPLVACLYIISWTFKFSQTGQTHGFKLWTLPNCMHLCKPNQHYPKYPDSPHKNTKNSFSWHCLLIVNYCAHTQNSASSNALITFDFITMYSIVPQMAVFLLYYFITFSFIQICNVKLHASINELTNWLLINVLEITTLTSTHFFNTWIQRHDARLFSHNHDNGRSKTLSVSQSLPQC